MQVKALSFKGVSMDIGVNNVSMVYDWMIGVVLAKILLARVWSPALACSRKATSSAMGSEFSDNLILAKPIPSIVFHSREGQYPLVGALSNKPSLNHTKVT